MQRVRKEEERGTPKGGGDAEQESATTAKCKASKSFYDQGKPCH